MKRRSFVKTSLLTSAAATVAPTASFASNAMRKAALTFYELRIYTLTNNTQQKLIEDYYHNAAIPALNKLDVGHVGVFTELKPVAQTKVYVLIPYKSMEHFENVTAKLESDSTYQNQGQAYLNAPATAPAYERIESSLLKAFPYMPKMEVPLNAPRIFELRQYQSASENAGKKKIEMFNDKGEIDIFKRLGFKPVFWGETMIGSARPNLTYMVTFDDMAAHEARWKAFGSDPEWKKLSAMPEYANALIISKINATFLVPTAFSQI
jgi:hypothetical protein